MFILFKIFKNLWEIQSLNISILTSLKFLKLRYEFNQQMDINSIRISLKTITLEYNTIDVYDITMYR